MVFAIQAPDHFGWLRTGKKVVRLIDDWYPQADIQDVHQGTAAEKVWGNGMTVAKVTNDVDIVCS